MLIKNDAAPKLQPPVMKIAPVKNVIAKPLIEPVKRKAREVVKAKESDVEDDIDDNSLDDYNMDYCGVCNRPGKIICCDTCPGAYHAECLGFERVIFNSKHSHHEASGDVIFVR